MKSRKRNSGGKRKTYRTRKYGGSPENVVREISRNEYKALPNKSIARIERPFGFGNRKKYGIGTKKYYVPRLTPRLTFIADGTYGAVFKGSINGEYKKDDVTKIYFKKEYNSNNSRKAPVAYDNEIERQKIIKKIIKSQEFPTEEYKHIYIKKNIYNTMPKNVKNTFNKRNTKTGDNQRLYMTKMPNLGTDIYTISEDKIDILTVVPFTKVATEILKLLNVVYEIHVGTKNEINVETKKIGYIHADIRPENVLVNLNKGKNLGEMTIIDFDLFTEKKVTYNHASYNMPPEFIVFRYLRDNLKQKPSDIPKIIQDSNPKDILDMIKKKLGDDTYEIWTLNFPMYRSIPNMVKKYFKNSESVGDSVNELINNIDLYGLGMCIYWLLYKYRNIENNTEIHIELNEKALLIFIIKQLLPNIMNNYTNTRWTIQHTINEYIKKLKECKIEIPDGYDKYLKDVNSTPTS